MTEDPNRLSQNADPADAQAHPELESAQRNAPQRRGPPPNPLYHPLFLPVLLVLFTLWFFWDGFITSDPDMQKHQLFNRISFGVTALFCLRVVPRGIREFREERAAAEKKQ